MMTAWPSPRPIGYPTDAMKNKFTRPLPAGDRDVMAADLATRSAAEISCEIQDKAATLLGEILFAFGELERDLALCLVWVREGRELETLTKQFEESSFSDKIERLERFVKSDFATNSVQYVAYSDWLARTDAVRLIRNDLAHGRWWFDPIQNCAFNISGIPTSAKQQQRPYTIEGLSAFLSKIWELQAELTVLRQTSPL